ncbi:hypothetical protein JXA80_12890, partial [bacterium]|nr:hypothetical protein [candidate division CSSED10-310 bacterium]
LMQLREKISESNKEIIHGETRPLRAVKPSDLTRPSIDSTPLAEPPLDETPAGVHISVDTHPPPPSSTPSGNSPRTAFDSLQSPSLSPLPAPEPCRVPDPETASDSRSNPISETSSNEPIDLDLTPFATPRYAHSQHPGGVFIPARWLYIGGGTIFAILLLIMLFGKNDSTPRAPSTSSSPPPHTNPLIPDHRKAPMPNPVPHTSPLPKTHSTPNRLPNPESAPIPQPNTHSDESTAPSPVNPDLHNTQPPSSEKIQSLLTNARHNERIGNYDMATALYRQVLNDDKTNAVAQQELTRLNQSRPVTHAPTAHVSRPEPATPEPTHTPNATPSPQPPARNKSVPLPTSESPTPGIITIEAVSVTCAPAIPQRGRRLDITIRLPEPWAVKTNRLWLNYRKSGELGYSQVIAVKKGAVFAVTLPAEDIKGTAIIYFLNGLTAANEEFLYGAPEKPKILP